MIDSEGIWAVTIMVEAPSAQDAFSRIVYATGEDPDYKIDSMSVERVR